MPLRSRAAHWTWIVAVALGLAEASAAAQERTTAQLQYDRDATASACPDEHELRDLVSARLGYVPFREESPLAIDVVIRSVARNLEARVSVREAQAAPGVRVLQSAGRDCVELSQALALAISVAIDPMSLMSTPAPEATEAPAETTPSPPQHAQSPTLQEEPPTETATSASTDTSRTQATPEASIPETRDERAQAWLGLLGEAQLGTLPQLAPALTLSADWRAAGAPVGLRAELGWVAPQARTEKDGSVHAWRFDGRALGCAHVEGLAACAGMAAGMLRARGDDIDPARSQTTWTAALAAEVGARVGISQRVAIELRGGVDVPLRRVALELNQQAVWTTSHLGLRLAAGLSWGFL